MSTADEPAERAPSPSEEADRLFAARNWPLLDLQFRDSPIAEPALQALIDVARLALRADEIETTAAESRRPHCLPLISDTVEAAWLLVNLRHEATRYRYDSWAPAGHYALHLAHRLLDTLLVAYLGFEFALGREKPGLEPRAVTRAVGIRLQTDHELEQNMPHIYVASYLGLLSKVADHGTKARVHPSYERLLTALGGAPTLQSTGIWRTLNKHRNDGVMGHGRESLDQFARQWAEARTDSADTPAYVTQSPDVATAESVVRQVAPSEAVIKIPASRTPPPPSVPPADHPRRRPRSKPPQSGPPTSPASPATPVEAIEDYAARLVRLAQCCQGLARSPHFDDEPSRERLLGLDWPRLRYCTGADRRGPRD